MRRLTIGQMTKLNHISEQVLRRYDRIGLFSPSIRGENGYRYYDIQQSAQLDIIQYLKSLGIPLKEIKRQLSEEDLSTIEAALQEKQRQTEGEIRRLKCQYRALERTLESFARYRAAPPDGTFRLEYIGPRLMYALDTGENFYAHGPAISLFYENSLRVLQDSLLKDGLPLSYFCNAGTLLGQEDFLQGRLYSTVVFVFVDEEFVPNTLTAPVPAGNYLCLYCDDSRREAEYILRLRDYAKSAGYEVCGDFLCESIADIPVRRAGSRGLYLRLQVPVRFR